MDLSSFFSIVCIFLNRWCCLFQENPLMRETFLDGPENFEVELDITEIDGADIDTIISSFGKIVKGFQSRNKHIADKFHEFCHGGELSYYRGCVAKL